MGADTENHTLDSPHHLPHCLQGHFHFLEFSQWILSGRIQESNGTFNIPTRGCLYLLYFEFNLEGYKTLSSTFLLQYPTSCCSVFFHHVRHHFSFVWKLSARRLSCSSKPSCLRRACVVSVTAGKAVTFADCPVTQFLIFLISDDFPELQFAVFV